MPDCKCKALGLSPVKTYSPGQQRILGKSGAASIFVHGKSTGDNLASETICLQRRSVILVVTKQSTKRVDRVHSLGFGALTLRSLTGMLGNLFSGQLRPRLTGIPRGSGLAKKAWENTL
jgi:hypothetical protein